MEEWRDIEEFEGLYQVSNEGRVRSLITNKIMKQQLDKCGYYKVGLYNPIIKKHINSRVSRLVAKAFIPNLENKPCCDHINTIRTDNRAENLRWADNKENSNNPLTIEKMFGHKRSCKKVYQYDLNGEFVGEYESAKKAAEAVNGTSAGISYCCLGGFYSSLRDKFYKCEEYKGYRWSYKPL